MDWEFVKWMVIMAIAFSTSIVLTWDAEVGPRHKMPAIIHLLLGLASTASVLGPILYNAAMVNIQGLYGVVAGMFIGLILGAGPGFYFYECLRKKNSNQLARGG